MAYDLIGRVRRLLVSPATEWEAIDGETADVATLYGTYVAPLAIFSIVVTFVGTYFFSHGIAGLRPLLGLTLIHAAISFVVSLALVYIFALVVNALAPSFGAQKNFGQAFKMSTYVPTPYWVGSVFLLIPAVSLLSGIVALYSLYLLFVGLPKIMKVPRDKVLLYTGVVTLCMLGLSIVVGWVAGIRPYY